MFSEYRLLCISCIYTYITHTETHVLSLCLSLICICGVIERGWGFHLSVDVFELSGVRVYLGTPDSIVSNKRSLHCEEDE